MTDIPLVYLAHPIDQGDLGHLTEVAAGVLGQAGCMTYDPGLAWDGPITGRIHHINLTVLAQCDLMVVVLDPARLTVGAVLEMMAFRSSCVVIYGPNLQKSVAMEAMHWRVTHDPIELATEIHAILEDQGYTWNN